MSDLKNPESKGTRMEPTFFVSGQQLALASRISNDVARPR